MKSFWLILATITFLAVPTLTSANAATSTDASGNGSAAAAATDGQEKSISTSGENASADASIDETETSNDTEQDVWTDDQTSEAISKQKDKASRRSYPKIVQAATNTPEITPVTQSADQEKSSTCNISSEQYEKISSQLDKIAPIGERTIKILNLLAFMTIGVGLIIILQIAILLKRNRRKTVVGSLSNIDKF